MSPYVPYGPNGNDAKWQATTGRLIFVAVFVVLAFGAAPGPTWQDASELGAAGFSLGVAHPTGFPLYGLMAKAATLIPIGDVAFRVHLLSALCMAGVARGLFGLATVLLGPGSIVAAVAAAVAPVTVASLFRQAATTEVYAPSGLLLVWGTYLMFMIRGAASTTGSGSGASDGDGKLLAAPSELNVTATEDQTIPVRSSQSGPVSVRWRARAGADFGTARGLLGALVAGLGLGLHPELRLTLVVPMFVWLLKRWWRRPGLLAASAAVFVLGAGVNVYLPLRAGRVGHAPTKSATAQTDTTARQLQPPVANWGAPSNARRFWDHVTARRIRNAYHKEMFSADVGAVSVRARRLGHLLLDEMGPMSLLVAVVGLFALGSRKPWAAAVLGWVLAVDIAFAIWINPMGLAEGQCALSTGLVWGLLVGSGLFWFGKLFGRGHPFVSAAAAAIALTWPIDYGLRQGYATTPAAERLLHAVLDETPPAGSVLAASDDVNALLLYARSLGLRPDVASLPVQHLWDTRLVAAVLAGVEVSPPRHGHGPGGDSPVDLVYAELSRRGPVLFEQGADPPPMGVKEVVPRLPLLELAPARSAGRAGDRAGDRPGMLSNSDLDPADKKNLAAFYRICEEGWPEARSRRVCASLLVGYGTSLLERGKIPAAKIAFEQALVFEEKHVPALVNLGVAYAGEGNVAKAAQLEEAALAIAPNHYSAAMNAARYRLATGDPTAAANHFVKALTVRPQATAALAGLGMALAKQGKLTEGARAIREAAKRDPRNPEVAQYAQELESLGRRSENHQ